MKAIRILAVVGLVAAILPLGAAPAGAQPALVLKTNYPGLVVEAGKTVKFDIDVITATPRRVDLAVVELPPGWAATIRGGGSVIDAVFGDDETPPAVELEVQVPPDPGGPGPFRVLLRGASAGLSDILTLTLRVGEAVGGAVAITSETTKFRGSSTDNFTISAKLENNTPEETSFSLAASGPRGWTVSATPSGEARAATVTVPGGGESDVSITADPPDNVPAGTYQVEVAANGGEGKTAATTFEIEITGNIELTLSTSDERLNRDGRAGRATDVVMVVRNTGTAPLRDVSFTSTPPTGWEVSFNPERIQAVEPGKEGRATARIVPSGEAVAGDYTLTISATGAGGGSGDAELRFTVRTSRFWLVVGLLIILGTFLGLRWVFQRYGRR